jgi:hypothetical protein
MSKKSSTFVPDFEKSKRKKQRKIKKPAALYMIYRKDVKGGWRQY